MNSEQQKQLQAHVQEIAAILYQNTPPEQLTSLEGIEIAVREQILTHVSPEIGNFLSAQVQAQKQAEADKSKVVLVNSVSRQSKRRS